MSRHDFRRPIENHIAAIRQALSAIPAGKRLHVIAEALYDLNPTGDREVLNASCGCYEWDISIDYRNADVRYAAKDQIAELEARTLTVKLPLMLSGSPHFNGGVKSMFKVFKQACDEQGITLVVGGE